LSILGSSQAPVPLGPFELERPIGRGGMAEVWLGVHRRQEQRVAVKILTGARAREEAFIRALKNEIHNVARLHHPGVILLFDTGEVDDVAERTTGGRFAAGSPWFAMELASHGALSPRRLPLPWPTTRMLLLSLLDALAHAHARGVIHRDIKPGNILLCAPTDPRPGLKLTDFGIAAPLGEHIDGEAEAGRLSGTPRYMAPEQFQARWRDFGPWTDLYALGCIAYQLATGKPPFSGDALRLAIAHCHDAAPAPKPVHEGFPEGFDAWVLRLLEKDPMRRFACAADAAWALLKLASDHDEDAATVVAGWEQDLRSLKPLLDRSLSAGATVALDDPSREDALEGDAHADEPGFSDEQRLELSSAQMAAAIASTNVTLLDRPSMLPKPVEAMDATVRKHSPMASQSSESSDVFTTSKPRAASSGARSVDVADDQFPPIAAEVTRKRKRKQGRSSSAGAGGGRKPGGKLVDTTFAANAPWTELAMLSPQETMPTESGRSTNGGSVRRPLHADDGKLAPRYPPPQPPTWRRPGPQAPSRHLLGAGLGLYGLRQIPLVDRDAERDLAWETLREVHEGKGARVLLLRGPAGIGKTRLAEWLVERAVEVGAAVGLRAGHGPGGGPLDGLAGLIALHARTIGLEKRELRRRLVEMVGRQGVRDIEEALALGELLEPSPESEAPPDPAASKARGRHQREKHVVTDGGDGAAPSNEQRRIRLDSARERHAVALRYLARAGADRPVVAWLDDVQWGGEAIAFARYVIEDAAARASPVLVILSASEEELGERPLEAKALEELVQLSKPNAPLAGAVVQVHVPDLPEKDHRALVGELLGLEAGLAALVAERTAGNPLFAVQLVGDFIMRGVLELTPHGFALRRGEQAVLPDDLHGVWSARIARALSRSSGGGRADSAHAADRSQGALASQAALELGAILGTAGDDGEWRAICEEAGVALSARLSDELLIERLLVPDDGGLRFAHAMLRESVLRLAEEGGRLEGHHRTAARMLLKRYGDRRGTAERVGRHLVQAGDAAAALRHLLRAAGEAARSVGYPQAHALLAEREAAVDKLGMAEDDPRRAEGWAVKASLLIDEGRYDEALMWANHALRHRHDARHARVVPTALRVRALTSARQGKWAEAEARIREGLAAAETVNGLDEIMECHVGLADVAYYRGRMEETGEHLSRALHSCQERGDQAGIAYCLWNASYVSLWLGHLDTARDVMKEQQRLARRAGHRSMIANGRNALGDLERMSGRYDDAERRYQEAMQMFEAIGSGKRRVVRANLAMNALARGNLPRARTLAAELLPEVNHSGERVLQSLCHGVLGAIAGHERRWDEHDVHIRELQRPRKETGLVDGEHALMFEIIGDYAREQGDDARAASAYENAIELWTLLNRKDRVDGVERALGVLGTVPMKLKRPPPKGPRKKDT
jgi:serine/threonine protein kinase/tetratricopeptide (TPR) repeat protein